MILNSGDRLASVDAGSSAFSNLGRSSVIPAMARGDTNFYYFANIDDSPGIEGCWARPGFASIKDLRGKKVAANTSAEITLSGLLATQGMTEKDVDYRQSAARPRWRPRLPRATSMLPASGSRCSTA